jgi:hypothetical protein
MVPDPAILNLKWEDLCDANWNFLQFEYILDRVRIDLDRDRMRKLLNGFQNARKKLFNENDSKVPIPVFFETFKKGSRSFRVVLSRSKLIPKIKNCPIKKFADTVNMNCPEPEIIRKINSRWHAQYYFVDVKTFLFKFYHNILGVNARVAHFNPERSSACSFCEKKLILPAPRETVAHFFWDCPVTYAAVSGVWTKFITFQPAKNAFFYGIDNTGKFSLALQIFSDLLRFSLWQMKLRKKLPNIHNLTADLQYFTNIVAGMDRKIEDLLNVCQIFRRDRDRDGE